MGRSRVNFDKERGFTLIEMMIVVAIIAILVAILVPNFMRARAQAQTAACEANLKEIATALELYQTDHQMYPDVTSLTNVTNTDTNIGAYLRQTPIDPVAPTLNYQYSVTGYNTGSASYTIVCPGGHDPGTMSAIGGTTAKTKINYTSTAGFGAQ